MKRLARLFSFALFLTATAFAVAVLYPRPAPKPSTGGKITRIVVEKAARRLVTYDGPTALGSYAVALGANPVGDKQRQGDGRTPEGTFTINRKNAGSAFTLSLGLDYPQQSDIIRANAGGFDPGGDIMIHGQPNGHADSLIGSGDWTAGCIAVSNPAIRAIFAAAEVGTVVEIRP
ncbi:MAG: L,D-transpeptidase family protein [bacterium]